MSIRLCGAVARHCGAGELAANDANYANGRNNDFLCAHSRNSRHWRLIPLASGKSSALSLGP